MRLGLVSDIHASHGSLSRAFDILADRRVDRVACLGDIVQRGDEGEAVVAMLRSHWVTCVQGNHDANAVRRAREDGDLGGLSPDSIAWLAQLPTELAYEWDGVRVVLAHAAPCGVDAYVWPDDIPKRLKRALRAVEHDVVVLGHTHVPMKVKYLDVWLINPGSVRGTHTRDSHTCGVLSLPSLDLEILSLEDGRSLEYATDR
jgi:putative phosphoesterase